MRELIRAEFTMIQTRLTDWLSRKTSVSGIRRVAPLNAAIGSDTGNYRVANEDRAAIGRALDKDGNEYVLFVVADGIGGMENGAACSALAVSSFITAVYEMSKRDSECDEDWLSTGVLAADLAVYNSFSGKGGSTLSAVLTRRDKPSLWANVGDSRVYCYGSQVLNQLTVDDTIAGQLEIVSGASVGQSQLIQFVGMGPGIEVNLGKIKVGYDSLLLTTDGVHFLSSIPKLMSKIISNSADPGMCVKRLVELSKWCGGTDNATAIAVFSENLERQECLPQEDCLEVWDAFGEIQIIGFGSRYPTENLLDESDFEDCPNQLDRDEAVLLNVEHQRKRNKKNSKESLRMKTGKKVKKTPRVDQSDFLVEFPSPIISK